MALWNLSVYRSLYDVESVPKGGTSFESTEKEKLLEALLKLKEKSPHCVPVVTLIPLDRERIIFSIDHRSDVRGPTPDAIFDDNELAYEWLELRIYNAQARYSSGVDVTPQDDYTIYCHQPMFDPPPKKKPKSIWEWLREPYPFSFD